MNVRRTGRALGAVARPARPGGSQQDVVTGTWV